VLNEIVYIPLGTLEWHSEHLPIETDFMIAKKICEILSEKSKGYILPPMYLGTDREENKNGVILHGMNIHLNKILEGSLYYIKPSVFNDMISSLVFNLKEQGFKKIVIVTGHAGSAHRTVLEQIEKDNHEVVYINVYEGIGQGRNLHAAKEETSLFWALYPEEEKIARSKNINPDNDLNKLVGFDVISVSSGEFGKEVLDKVLSNIELKLENK
jgi:creatinine amidohydrolase